MSFSVGVMERLQLLMLQLLALFKSRVLVNGQTEDVDLGGGAISPACDPALQQQRPIK